MNHGTMNNYQKNEIFYPEKLIFLKNSKKFTSYQPLNKKKPINSSFIDLNEILKKENLNIMPNNDLKKMILNFTKEKKIKKKLIRNKSNITIPTTLGNMLLPPLKQKKNFSELSISSSMNKSKYYLKIKKSSSQQKKNLKKNLFYTTETINKNTLLNSYKRNSRNILKNKVRSISQDNIFESKNSLENNSIIKIPKIRNYIRIKSTFIKSSSGQLDPLTITKDHFKKLNQDNYLSKLNFFSKSLGLISLIGIFDGHGIHGHIISKIVKNFFLDYFENNINMTLSITKDNYYTILNESFIKCQKYLINNSSNLNYNINNSGCTCIIIFYPYGNNNNKNKIFCANCGNCKCLLYSNNNYIPLSYPHIPERKSEGQRMKERIEFLEKKKLEEQLLYSIENNDEKIIEKNNNMINMFNPNLNLNEYNEVKKIEKISKNPFEKFSNSIKYLFNKKMEDDIKKEKLEVKKTSYLKEFKELNLSRSLGDLYCQELGIISEPEIVEIDLKYNKGRYIVLGTNSLFTYLTNEEIGNIVKKHYYENNGAEACKELEELARERWKRNVRKIDDITIIIIFLDFKR